MIHNLYSDTAIAVGTSYGPDPDVDASTGAGAGRATLRSKDDSYLAQVDITEAGSGTVTVTIQGRLGTTMAWYDIQSFSASGAAFIGAFPLIRVKVVAVTEAIDAVDVKIAE